jgi:pimeloyl-ACP methyl ester carboxylesterase
METHVEFHTVTTAVGPLAVQGMGDGPPALLWHSLFIDSAAWKRVTPALALDRRLILIDGPGHGRSGDPGHRYTMADCAQAALEVLDAVGAEGRVDWLGNAWGGHVGILAATDHPDRVRTLVAFGTPIRSYHPAERRRVQALALAYRLMGAVRFLVDGVVEVQLSPATRLHDRDAVAMTADFLRDADRRRLYNAIASISLGRQNLHDRLSRLSIPTLFVTGTDHSGFTPDEARAAISQVPGGTIAVVPDAAYLIPLEQPDRSIELILGFWAGLDEQE